MSGECEKCGEHALDCQCETSSHVAEVNLNVWVSVKEHGFPKLSTHPKQYLAVDSRFGVGFIWKHVFIDEWNFTTDHKIIFPAENVTHWMSLPG